MATYNPNLENLNLEEILAVSERYLMGWQDLIAEGYGFRVKGLNRRRAEFGLEPLTRELSNQHRLAYIRSNFTQEQIDTTISEYLQSGRVGDTRWTGICLFDCRFGREYAALFRELMGSAAYRKAGEAARVKKLTETQESLYGGVGLGGEVTKQKARDTVQARYGVHNVMLADSVKATYEQSVQAKYGGPSPFSSPDVREKAASTKWQNIQDRIRAMQNGHMRDRLLKSRAESIVYLTLADRFGTDDVFYEYGIHPSDRRYPHNCDFYIKSLDLFIELNGHYSHGGHWFDPSNHDDVLRVKHLLDTGAKKSREAVDSWTKTDVRKRADAKRSGIKFLVFWDGTFQTKANGGLPNLSDFYEWFREYDCDYDRFIKDHPENTY